QAPGTPAGFEIDGTQICQDDAAGTGAGDDWADDLTVPCDGEVDPPVLFSGAQFTDCNWGNQGDGGDSTQFKGHSNKNSDLIGAGESPWNWASQGGGPQKNDLTNIYVHRRVDGGEEWLFVGAETRSTNGDSHIDFEVNQAGVVLQGGNVAVGCVHGQVCCDLSPAENGNIIGNGAFGGRTVDDIIMSIDFVQGGVQPELTVRKWDGAQYIVVPGVAGVTVFSQTNTSDIDSGTNWDGFKSNGATNLGTVKALQFVEGAINLTALGIAFDPCSTDATLMVKTRSSHSFTAELKDFALFPFPVPPFPTCIPEDDEVCDGDDAQLCATIDAPAGNLTAPFTMVWKDPSGASIQTFDNLMDGDTRCIDIPVADAGDAGTYTVEITDIRDCTPQTCMPVLTVNPEPTADAGPDEAECEVDGTDPTLGGSPTATGGTPGYTYAWTGSCQPFLDDDTAANPVFDLDAAGPGTYDCCVEVTDSNGCTDDDCMDVTVYPEPTADAGPDEAECEVDGIDPTLGGSPTASGGTPGYTYVWTGSCQPFLDDETAANPVFDLDAAGPGTYDCCVQVTDSNGCKDDDCMEVTVYEEPTCTVEPALVCTGEEMCAVPSGGTAPYTFQWSSGEMTQCITPTTEGFFTVTVTDFNGCVTDCQGEAELCGEACSPGFWRNNLDSWCSETPFNPRQDFCSAGAAPTGFVEVFGACPAAPSSTAIAKDPGLTLHEAVNSSGGTDQTLFHCTAALLSAHAVSFPVDPDAVISTVQDACDGTIPWMAA
ncbi:MAG: hypothetical protein IIA44_13010, partial [Acidobacteria bacterium]|nr:hypothetical protein [Acidobacteriota bacterium]